jgi:hypothetical protein
MIVKMAGGWLEEEQERMTGRGGVMIVRHDLGACGEARAWQSADD